ncbi:TonB-dependent receptor [Algoriphagus machipongonensis]|uniref:TonB-dependent receptor n=2 Tax=Algoriphagus machipongonensis TaxID=388413 RepID=A3HW05_9BACT|nr:TonB-dependent receptor [Algoriphagus machipongonensis]
MDQMRSRNLLLRRRHTLMYGNLLQHHYLLNTKPTIMKNLLLLFFFLSAGIVKGQDLFQKNLYSADKVMKMREELDLTDSQVANIKKAYSKNAGEFSTLKWDLDEETEKLKSLIDQSKIDQTAVQKQMDVVLKLENQLKKMQLDNLVAIKNELSSEQQELLQKNNIYIIRGVGQVNGVRGASSIKGSNVVTGYTASPGSVITWNDDKIVSGTKAYSPKVSVMVAGADENKKPVFYIDTKDGLKEVKNLDNIDPSDIQSMEVFKGEKAIEKFGKKAENGAILIKLRNEPK